MNFRNIRVLWHAVSGGVMLVAYLVCRFGMFHLHGMKQWPTAMAAAAAIILINAAITDSRIVSAFTTFGYILGFVMGMVLSRTVMGIHGEAQNDAWFIWGFGFAICVIVGVVLNILDKRLRRKNT